MSCPLHSTEQAAGLANPTEARAGAHEVGIPEGGRFAHSSARSAEGLRPSTDQQAPEGRGDGVGEQRARTATARPEVYTCPQARNACRTLLGGEAERHRNGEHYLHLDDREFMHVVSCIEHDRNRMRKAIKKGLAVEADMRTSNSLWDKLQIIRAQRQFGRRA